MASASNKEILNTSGAAELLGVHPDTLRRWDEQGFLKPAYRLPGIKRQRRYKRADVLEWMKSGGESIERQALGRKGAVVGGRRV